MKLLPEELFDIHFFFESDHKKGILHAELVNELSNTTTTDTHKTVLFLFMMGVPPRLLRPFISQSTFETASDAIKLYIGDFSAVYGEYPELLLVAPSLLSNFEMVDAVYLMATKKSNREFLALIKEKITFKAFLLEKNAKFQMGLTNLPLDALNQKGEEEQSVLYNQQLDLLVEENPKVGGVFNSLSDKLAKEQSKHIEKNTLETQLTDGTLNEY